MILQLLVNHYHEDAETVARFLKSVEMQEGVADGEFEVLLYSDGCDVILENSFLNGYSFPVRYRTLEHRGVTATRNALLDDATSDYVMFCDVDDCFHSSLGLYKLIRAIRDLGVNVIGSPYEAELLHDGKIWYKTIQRDTIRVHGKAFRRQYLLDNHIRFPEEMTFSGDQYFLWLAYNLDRSYAWMRDSFYIWKYNLASITRKDVFHILKSYSETIHCYTLLAKNLEKRGCFSLRDISVAATVCMMYLDDTDAAFMNGPEEYIRSAKDAICAYLDEFGNIIDNIPSELMQARYVDAVKAHATGLKCASFDNLYDWIHEIHAN